MFPKKRRNLSRQYSKANIIGMKNLVRAVATFFVLLPKKPTYPDPMRKSLGKVLNRTVATCKTLRSHSG